MAENDGKIYITISDRRFGSNVAEADAQNKIDKEKDKNNESTLLDFAQHQFFNLVERQAKQVVSYTLGNIGNFTGNYVAQDQVNAALSMISSLQGIAVGALAGAKFGPVGALVGAGIAIAGQATTQAINLYTGYLDNTRQNRAIDQLRTRAGLNSKNNGSRGTDQ